MLICATLTQAALACQDLQHNHRTVRHNPACHEATGKFYLLLQVNNRKFENLQITFHPLSM